ncbi:cell division cycle- protein [Coemansia spiralis]|uniref:Cell division cycle- protein n=1 Tax=Coemansia spiralis TaxID=417178 RepID=A0A9W8G3D1_9FUNG|nr:cell division cycle- protein [Coemansia spiralis]
MDPSSNRCDYAFVPAALQSGPPTPSRQSYNENTGTVGEGSMQPNQPYASESLGAGIKVDNDAGKVQLKAFPRPRPSFEDDIDRPVKENGDDDDAVPVDPRLERRKRNQYKRNGSLTLAWQQQQQQQQQINSILGKPSRLSSEISTEAPTNLASASPMSTPVVTWNRSFLHTNNISKIASSSSGDIASMRNSSKPPQRLKSGSFAAAGADRIQMTDSIRQGVAGFFSAFSSSNSRDSLKNKIAASSCNDAYCMETPRADGSSSTGRLFAPVNSSRRASGSESRYSIEQYDARSSIVSTINNSSNSRGTSNLIAYYTRDATVHDELAGDVGYQSLGIESSNVVADPLPEDTRRPSSGNLDDRISRISISTSRALAALCSSLPSVPSSVPSSEDTRPSLPGSTESLSCMTPEATSASNELVYTQGHLSRQYSINMREKMKASEDQTSSHSCAVQTADQPLENSICADKNVPSSAAHSSTTASTAIAAKADRAQVGCGMHSNSAQIAIISNCRYSTWELQQDNCSDSTSTHGDSIPQWLTTVAQQKNLKQKQQTSEQQQSVTVKGGGSSGQPSRQCTHVDAVLPECASEVCDSHALVNSSPVCLVKEEYDDDLVPLGLRECMQIPNHSCASASVGTTGKMPAEADIHERFVECDANGGGDSCSNNRMCCSANRMAESSGTSLDANIEKPAYNSQSPSSNNNASRCLCWHSAAISLPASAVSSSSPNSFVLVSGNGSKHSSRGSSSAGALFFSSSFQQGNSHSSYLLDNPVSISESSYIPLSSDFSFCSPPAHESIALPVATYDALVGAEYLQLAPTATSLDPSLQNFSLISQQQLHYQDPGYSGPYRRSIYLQQERSNTNSNECAIKDLECSKESKAKYCRHQRLLSNPPKTPLPRLPSDMATAQSLSTSGSFQVAAAVAVSPSTDVSSASAGRTASSTAVCTPVALVRAEKRSGHAADDSTVVGPSRFRTAEVRSAEESPTQMIAQKQRQQKQQQYLRAEDFSSSCQSRLAQGLSVDDCITNDGTMIHAEGSTNGSLYDQHMHRDDTHLKAWNGNNELPTQRRADDMTRHPTMIFDNSPIFRASTLIETALTKEASVEHDGGRRSECHSDSEASSSPINSRAGDRGRIAFQRPQRMRSLTDSTRTSRTAGYECRASEELAHENGMQYSSSKSAEARLVHSTRVLSTSSFATLNGIHRKPIITDASPSVPMPRPHTAGTIVSERPKAREATDSMLYRNSLFSNVVKQQSRCLSVLLQQGSHGGLRRIGPLLITMERGGAAIRHLNPAFIDMMDVHPVDKATTIFLKKSNIRRRSFSMPPSGPGNDWLDTLSDIIGASKDPKSTKQDTTDSTTSSGPGMWWPLNDDNCSDEVSHDVQIAAHDTQDQNRDKLNHNRAQNLERMGSSSTIAGATGFRPLTPLEAGRKGSVSSQLRLMGRADHSSANGNSANGNNGGHGCLRSNASYNSLGGPPPTLVHSLSDASESSVSVSALAFKSPQSSSSANMQMHSFTHQLADVTMKTESGVITRSVKCISLRLLVNRLASPEGNVDSDLMTDFLNSYRFFAHPIDVMRLIIVRYLNCFVISIADEDGETSDADDAESNGESESKYLTINGWRNRGGASSNTDSSSQPNGSSNAKTLSSDQKISIPSSSSNKKLPPLARNDGAIIQLRVMNIIKYWIKFHPHDFRLHHRLTRLLLLFLSHIQKQPGRADFVNSIRQKLSSGRLLAVEMPAFASTITAPVTTQTTAVPSQASSVRSSGIHTPAIETARSAIDLQSAGLQRVLAITGTAPGLRPETSSSNHQQMYATTPSYLRDVAPSVSLYGQYSGMDVDANTFSLKQPADVASGFSVPVATSNSRGQHVKKGSTSYFKSLFQSRSSKNSTSASDLSGQAKDSEGFGGLNSNSVRIAQRSDAQAPLKYADLAPVSDIDEHGMRVPNGNMYASDFGQLVMEALANSGVPTPQTPVGRTLLNYTIANRNPYRINLIGIDPATFAEQLTLLEHELFSRISATEFSLKGRVGNLETILHTMQGMVSDSRSSASTLGGSQQPAQGQTSPNNPVPNLTAMTSWFNQATYWTVLSVLSEPTTAARALVIKQLIHIALHCLARRNYYGAFEIAIALDNSAVRRLQDSWALVPELMKDIVAQILEVLQSRMNFRTYRESLKAALTGASGPDEEIFNFISEQVKIARAKDMIAMSSSQVQDAAQGGASGGSSIGHSQSTSGSGIGNFVHGTLFGGSSGEDGKTHSRKKSSAHTHASLAKNGPLLSEQDCACIMYAIRIRAASFMYFDPSSAGVGDSLGNGHSSVPVPSSSKSGRGSASHMSAGSSKSGYSGFTTSTGSSGNSTSRNGNSYSDGSETGDARNRRARSASNGSSGSAGGKSGSGFRQDRMITNGAPLPLVPFIAVHMTDLFHADQANSTYSEEHQKMWSRNPTGPEAINRAPHLMSDIVGNGSANRRQVRCDSAAISNVNQAQPLLNMQKFRLITTMFRELHLAQRTKYPYAADMLLQQQIHSAVRNIKAQANDIYSVVEDVAIDETMLARPATSYSSPFARARTGSSASRMAMPDAESADQQSTFGYPLYQIASLQKNQNGTSLLDASIDWDFADLKDNQELEQRLYLLSKWVEPSSNPRR